MYGSGPGKVDLHVPWTLSKRLGLAYSKIDLSLLQRQSASQEKHGRPHIFQHQSTGYLRIRGQETLYETCAACAYQPFSVTSEESLRDSEPPLNGYPSTKGQETS